MAARQRARALLIWLGAATALANGMIVVIAGIVLVRAYGRRIEAEERMLLDAFGDEYRRYVARTHRLVPFLDLGAGRP